MDEEYFHAAVPQLSDRQRRALAEAEQWIGGNIQGVAIGATVEGSECVGAYVEESGGTQTRDLPATFQGVPVQIEPIGPIYAEGESGGKP